ncbi:hypothetical protein [Sphingomonas sp.]|uniref:hypothetical protein n=1 Tax=Sphingomonas sp. TaxID=28214 RepID=UPI00286BED68|nr:hypothetical protein [Sphingomonas sp.]
MLAFFMGMALIAASSNDNVARDDFAVCLKGQIAKATAAKIEAAAFAVFARSACAAQASGFRNALIAYDLKAGWTRKKAEPDADAQIGDYLADWADRYKDSLSAK